VKASSLQLRKAMAMKKLESRKRVLQLSLCFRGSSLSGPTFGGSFAVVLHSRLVTLSEVCVRDGSQISEQEGIAL